MIWIYEYVKKVEELIEKPRNELRYKASINNNLEYKEILSKYEDAYMEKCLKIEEYLEEEFRHIKGYNQKD